MSYLPYVIGAYSVFVLALLWDFLAPRVLLRRELRAVRQRAQRQRKAIGSEPPSGELTR
ncbi:MAG: heme exporter protein CcmD [Stenotrophomonas sp.]|uniref:heme exporter protein CcmD n=1 Tax=Stenotrophomonas sp. TaxID=69392 RepID=UPI003D6CDF56